MSPEVVHRVAVIGTGMIGTSVALALREAGTGVTLSDRDPDAVAAAVRMGAGAARRPSDPPADVVVIATPPSTVAEVLKQAQARGLGSVYTDVASTKAGVVADAARAGCDLARYVPGHPLAGRELAGPAAANAGLFAGRPWLLCPHPATELGAVRTAMQVIRACRAVPRLLTADTHDRVVAAVSHAPHVVSAALAARFTTADDTTLELAGRGLHDTTRIAHGPPGLWTDILRGNAGAVATVLEAVVDDLASVAADLRSAAATGLRDAATADLATLTDLLSRGNRGRARIKAAKAAPRPADHPAPAPAWPRGA
ncbi:prephenate dehydrogenase [Actinomadura livida]|uniref:Prephenate dehydrogenase n=1 Tax=Actinomadura livida TaxID=79909 RepID=A0A7W7MW20_9ACTN|nr:MULTISPECIES: prephenate dehydrogenase [Actinomadura]MBB4772430.1 prephenate dehydrogenase [Actinomadura catellatispora]GGU23009.1 hypothetical protein GCM10010208_55010 [Actinomadura livida]